MSESEAETVAEEWIAANPVDLYLSGGREWVAMSPEQVFSLVEFALSRRQATDEPTGEALDRMAEAGRQARIKRLNIEFAHPWHVISENYRDIWRDVVRAVLRAREAVELGEEGNEDVRD